MLAPIPRGPDPGREREPVPEEVPPWAVDLAFDRAFTLQEVAERLGISLRQVQAHVADGSLPAVNVGRGIERRDLRVLDDDLDAFARNRLVPTTAIAIHRARSIRRRS